MNPGPVFRLETTLGRACLCVFLIGQVSLSQKRPTTSDSTIQSRTPSEEWRRGGPTVRYPSIFH